MKVTRPSRVRRQITTPQNVKAFVGPNWTFEFCLFKSTSLSPSFKQVLLSVHSKMDANDIERELAKKLINKLDKVEIAYRLARILEVDRLRETPEITIDENDASINYLLEATKYACGY